SQPREPPDRPPYAPIRDCLSAGPQGHAARRELKSASPRALGGTGGGRAPPGTLLPSQRFLESWLILTKVAPMPDKQTIEKARADKRAGKSPSTQAGEFVRAEIEKVRRGEHGVRSPKQAIAIGLSEARRAGVDLPPPKKGKAKERTRRGAEYASEAGQGRRK